METNDRSKGASNTSPMVNGYLNKDGNPITTHIDPSYTLSEKNVSLLPMKSEVVDVSGEKEAEDQDAMLADKQGLLSPTALFVLFLWYFFSAITLFLNKYILVMLKADAILLATIQMVITCLMGLFNMYYPCGMFRDSPKKEAQSRPSTFYRNMAIVGSTRFLVVFLGLVALKYVAVSFTETVKSSAPLFTVVFSRLLLGERNGVFVMGSLMPIMSGLALCSAYELSFNIQGFVSALGTNMAECLQFVCSKLFVSGEKYKTSPAEFQFYTCFASLILQTPVCLLLADVDAIRKTDMSLIMLMIINGLSYHFQTMMAWLLMTYVSPVTHSVANTVKRAILIWLSVLIFGNKVTFLSGLGTGVVFIGVLLYNKARDHELLLRSRGARYGDNNHKGIVKL